ncbi:photosystem II repair protein Psb32 [Gloeocapsa sp. PCC 73106]|uniref:photosystem II repair protein Psb32 n=1 Tax=Gloeocapsa sp. PCC 73106 TaxID=102232 RepID=UPI0002AC5AB3|nr:TPM domain-containing protein [Gloeocapsa sp. PCC 73106]ELR98124.1 beta-propeller domain-containing protein, methanol dehydrogenase [Gloeocapsa sp. PCC 73106]
MKFLLKLCLLIFASTISLTPAWATGVYDLPVPDASTWVIDQAEVISRSNEGQLSTTLANLAKTTGNQVRVVAIRRLDYGQNIETLSDELFTTWFPTLEAQSHQTLIVLDTLTNDAAIRTGTEVKTLLDDATATSVVEETIGIPLKQGNKYNQAFLGAGDRLVAILSGAEDPGPPQFDNDLNLEGTFTQAEDTKKGNAAIWVIVLLVLATVIPMATYFFYMGFPN